MAARSRGRAKADPSESDGVGQLTPSVDTRSPNLWACLHTPVPLDGDVIRSPRVGARTVLLWVSRRVVVRTRRL